jgi:hypothetical protein
MADKEDIGFVGIPENSKLTLNLPPLPDFSSFAVPPELPKITLDFPILTPAIFSGIIYNMLKNMAPSFPDKPNNWESMSDKQKMTWLLTEARDYLTITLPNLNFDENILQDCLEFLKALVPKITLPAFTKEDIIKVLKMLVPNISLPDPIININSVINALRAKFGNFHIPESLTYDPDDIAGDTIKLIKSLFPAVDINLMIQQIYFPLATVLAKSWQAGDSLVTKFATTYPNVSFLTTNTSNKKFLFRIKLGNELRLYDPKAKIHWEYYLRMKNCVLQNYLKNAILINYAYTGIIQSVPPQPDPLISWQARIKGFKKDLKENYDNFQDFLKGVAEVIGSAQIEPVIPTCKFQQEATFNSALTLNAQSIKDSDNLYEDNLKTIASAVILGTMTTGVNPIPIVAQNLAANSSGMAQMINIVFLA